MTETAGDVKQALARHGFDWPRLERLGRAALTDRMQKRGINLDPLRHQEALEFYVDVGARWAFEYDSSLAGGQSFATSCYRRMYPRLTDYLRQRHGDARRGNPLHENVTATGLLPDVALIDEPTFEQLFDELSVSMNNGWRLKALQIAWSVVVDGLPSVVVAGLHQIDVLDVGEHLEGLGYQLGYLSAVA